MLAGRMVIWQGIDLGLLVCGAVGAVACGAALLRSGRWRNPLGRPAEPRGGPGLTGVVVAFLGFLWLQQGMLSFAFDGRTPAYPLAPGSVDWHLAHAVGAAAESLVNPLMIVLLVSTRSFPARPRSGLVRGTLAGVAGMLLVTPILLCQLRMGEIAWQWLQPEATPPMHVVLEGLRTSALGDWGRGQLALSAVLVAPLFEELLFRGLLLQVVWQYLRVAWVAIVVSALVFGLVHMAQPQDVPPLVTLGLALGYLRVRTGSLWPGIVLHAAFNGRTIALALLAPELLEEA